MEVSFQSFLMTGKFGELAIGDSKSFVKSKLGIPVWWEGKATLSCDQSNVWSYEDVGIVFDKSGSRVIKIEIVFEDRDDNNSLRLTDGLNVSDVAFNSETTIGQFVERLVCSGLTFNQDRNNYGEVLIRIPGGSVAAFREKVDYERSIALERRIASDELYLESVRIEQE
ncbi:hypothetical protein PLANPX_2429 [Lacipirellula parvula]|uniref:Uncharacterized protein n=2 Tax=Lacipirellula parvula TaxID=2650471 RepID=A0A5K7XA78_9BACT|nr:hypothetical protein PLANPX_2429 [Lacipirellula parvula]